MKPCGAYLDADVGVEEFKKLSIQVSNIEDKIVKLQGEKDPLDGWFGTRATPVINKEIATLASKKNLRFKAPRPMKDVPMALISSRMEEII